MVPESKSDMTFSQQLVYDWFQGLQYPAMAGDRDDLAGALLEASEPPIQDTEKLRQIIDELIEGNFIVISPINLR